MNRQRRLIRPFKAGTMAFFALALLGLIQTASADHSRKYLKLDVAMIGQTFFDFEPHPDPAKAGVPPNGSPFVVQGWLYRGGTFEKFGNLSGVNADGSPEFPDRVVGKWICRGWHLQDGDALTGPVVVTTQVFDFNPDGPGSQTLVTDGIELADFDVAFKRAVTGGTGAFKLARGEVVQTYVGFPNASGNFNSSFVLRLSQAAKHLPLQFQNGD